VRGMSAGRRACLVAAVVHAVAFRSPSLSAIVGVRRRRSWTLLGLLVLAPGSAWRRRSLRTRHVRLRVYGIVVGDKGYREGRRRTLLENGEVEAGWFGRDDEDVWLRLL